MVPDAAGDERTLDHIQTLALRYDSGTNQCRISPSEAIRAAGLDPETPIRYLTDVAETLGVVPAVSVDDTATDERTYSIVERGATGGTFQLTLGPEVLDALGIDPDAEGEELHGPTPPLLDVYAGAGVIALDRAASTTLPKDVLSTAIGGVVDDLTVESAQMTVPRNRGSSVIASITPAFNRAGGDLKALEFLPDLAPDLDGMVVGIAREDYHGGTNIRSVSREGPDRQGATVSLSEDVLDALGLSVEDFHDVPRSEAPLLIVSAGKGVIGLSLPSSRTIGPLSEASRGIARNGD